MHTISVSTSKRIEAGANANRIEMELKDCFPWSPMKAIWYLDDSDIIMTPQFVVPKLDNGDITPDCYVEVYVNVYLCPWELQVLSSRCVNKLRNSEDKLPALPDMSQYVKEGDVRIDLKISITENGFRMKYPRLPVKSTNLIILHSITDDVSVTADYDKLKLLSPYFENSINFVQNGDKQKGLQESKEKMIELPESSGTIRAMLDWMDKVPLEWNVVLALDLLRMAYRLMIPSLKAILQDYFCFIIDIHNCQDLTRIADIYSLGKLKISLSRFRELPSTKKVIVEHIAGLRPVEAFNMYADGLAKDNSKKRKRRLSI